MSSSTLLRHWVQRATWLGHLLIGEHEHIAETLGVQRVTWLGHLLIGELEHIAETLGTKGYMVRSSVNW